jgi:hypothetical protein
VVLPELVAGFGDWRRDGGTLRDSRLVTVARPVSRSTATSTTPSTADSSVVTALTQGPQVMRVTV